MKISPRVAALSAVVSLGFVFAGMRIVFGSFWAASAFASGMVLLVEDEPLEILATPGTSEVVAEFAIRNLSFRPVKIYGAQPDCGCSVVESLPMTLAPCSSGSVRLRIHVEGQAEEGVVSRAAVLFTDPPTNISITVLLRVQDAG